MDARICFWFMISIFGVFGLEPSFDVPIINVTVHEGDTALLPCSVDYLGEHKVVWTDQWSTLLTLDDRRIIDDPRISIERPYTRDWNLHIRKTTYNDRGQYTCQINTNPVKIKVVQLIVLVPSKIINELSSRDLTVREGATVTLVCNVTGVPTPNVTWFKLPNDGTQTKQRLDLDPGFYTTIGSCGYTLQQTGISNSGEILIIHNVSRYCDGAYECVAYNNVEPAATKQIKVFVEFAPEVNLPNKRLGHFVGRETIMDCEITAFPHSVMYWTKDGSGTDLMNKEKYQVELYSGSEESTRKTLSLRVKGLLEEDFGEYTCFASNSIGQDKNSLILYNYALHTLPKVTTPRPALIVPTPGSHKQWTISNVTTRRHVNLKPEGSSPDAYNRGRQTILGENSAALGFSNFAGRTCAKIWPSALASLELTLQLIRYLIGI